MRCEDVAELLLAYDRAPDPEVEQHVADCQTCAHVAIGLRRLDSILASSVVVEPPLDVQWTLARLAFETPVQIAPWWQRPFNFDWLTLRPAAIAVQGLAAVMLVLASWQVFGWLNLFRPVIGDVGYAMQLVVASPAAAYLGGLQIDVQSLTLWGLVGTLGWLVSENGVVGQRLSSLTQRLRLS